MTNGRGYRWIKDLKRQTGKNIPELLALSHHTDPFYTGSKQQEKEAKWFAKMWEQQYKGQTGIHLRRVHYHLDAIGYPNLEGLPYTNCTRDWDALGDCSRYARILGLVPADAFDDHRNWEPHDLNWRSANVREPSVIEGWQAEWFLPSLRLSFASLNWTLDAPAVHGYAPDDSLDRACLLELWIEKSTMDDILVPLAQELGIRLATASGFQSISNVVKFLQRVHALGKLCRLFYISDYDAAGQHMPVQVSRQIEFWLPVYAPGADVKLQPLVLTREQIAKHKLPWSDNNTVELDALEALHPGELAKIVRRAVQPYLDDRIDEQLAEAQHEARQIVQQEWSSLMAPCEQRLRALRNRVQSVTKKYQREATSLNKRLQSDLAKFKKPLQQLQADVSENADRFDPDLPARPAQALSDQDESDWLFDSSREYLHQLSHYKAHGADKPVAKKHKSK